MIDSYDTFTSWIIKMSSSQYVVGDHYRRLQSWSAVLWMQSAAHTIARGSLMMSAAPWKLTLADYSRCFRNVRLLQLLTSTFIVAFYFFFALRSLDYVWCSCALGQTALIQSIFPPFPLPNYVPDFTLYDKVSAALNLNWTVVYDAAGQMPTEAIWAVCESLTKYT